MRQAVVSHTCSIKKGSGISDVILISVPIDPVMIGQRVPFHSTP